MMQKLRKIIALIVISLICVGNICPLMVKAEADVSIIEPTSEVNQEEIEQGDKESAVSSPTTKNILSSDNQSDATAEKHLTVTCSKESDFDDNNSVLFDIIKDDEDLTSNLKSYLVEQNSAYDYDIKSVLPMNISIIDENSSEIKNLGKVTVKVEMDNIDELTDTKLYHQKDDQTWECLPYTTTAAADGDRGFVEFTTESFSPFIFADIEQVDIMNTTSDSETPGIMPMADEGNAYAILYTDNSMVFQRGDVPEEGKTVVSTWTGFETAQYSNYNSVPWSLVRGQVKSITFKDSIKPTSTALWFFGFSSLTSIDFTKLDTSNVTDMNNMFRGCYALENLDVSNFNTSKVTNMQHMFSSCLNLKNIDLSNFDTSNVADMSYMFYMYQKATALDLSGFNMQRVKNTQYMFYNCTNLLDIKFSQDLDTGNLTNMSNMFYYCKSLKEINLSSFDTNNVTDMSYMLAFCSNARTIDLSSFNTNNVTNISYMLNGCKSLQVLKTQDTGKDNIALPTKMIEQDSPDGVVYGVMPSGSKTLVLFTLDYLENVTETMISFRKLVNGSLINIGIYDFGVYNEDNELLDTIHNDNKGNLSVETKDYAPGRYYVQEIAGSSSTMIYDSTKYYFTIELQTEKIIGTSQTTTNIFTSVDSSILTDYTLVADAFKVSAVDADGNVKMTMPAYCANMNKHLAYGGMGKVYIDPTDAEIDEARGEPYTGSQENVSDAIRCILYYERDNAQTRIWDLFNRDQLIDVSKASEIPADFHYAIISPSDWSMQPLIVPINTVATEVTEEDMDLGETQTRVVKMESPNVVFNNQTKDAKNLVKIMKWDVTNDKVLAGAHLQVLYNDNGKECVFDEWDSSDSFHTVTDLVPGVTYTLRETSSPKGYSISNDTTFILNSDGKIDMDNTSTPINDDGVLLVNDKQLGKIKVNKIVTGSMGNKAKDFTFEIRLTGDDLPDSITYTKDEKTGTINLTNGVGTFTLSDSETIVLNDIYVSCNYEIIETNSESSGYKVTAVNAKGTVTKLVDVTFTNNREMTVPTAAHTNVILVFGLALVSFFFILLFLKSKMKRA